MYQQIRRGDYFSSGGWNGFIKSIIQDSSLAIKHHENKRNKKKSHEESISEKKQLYHENILNQDVAFEEVDCANAGTAANITISLHTESTDPQPLGDQIIFYSGGLHVDGKDKQYDKFSEEWSHRVADEERMIFSLNGFAISYDQVRSFGVDSKWRKLVGQRLFPSDESKPYSKTILTVSEGEDDEEDYLNNDDQANAIEESCPAIDYNLKVVVKADSGMFSIEASRYLPKHGTEMTLGTIQDATNDFIEKYSSRAATSSPDGYKTCRCVVGWGIGEISPRDVQLAIAASGRFSHSLHIHRMKQILDSNDC